MVWTSRSVWEQLEPTDRRRASRARRALSTACLSDDYLLETGRQLSALFPESSVAIYTRRPTGLLDEIVHSGNGPLRRAPFIEPVQQYLQGYRRYVLRGADPYANRAVSTRTLYRGRRDELQAFREFGLHPYGAHYQLRVAAYHRRSFQAYIGAFRPRGCGEYQLRERMLLDAVAPTVVDSLVMMRVIGTRHSPGGQVMRALEVFEEPAFLVTEHGAVGFANQSARRDLPRLPEWLPLVPRFETMPPALGKAARLELDGKGIWLVLPRCSPWAWPDRGPADPPADLPPSLARVAELLMAGCSDKEIAARTEWSLATVRTYVTRLFRRLGVHSRAELVARYGSSAPADPTRPQSSSRMRPPSSKPA